MKYLRRTAGLWLLVSCGGEVDQGASHQRALPSDPENSGGSASFGGSASGQGGTASGAGSSANTQGGGAIAYGGSTASAGSAGFGGGPREGGSGGCALPAPPPIAPILPIRSATETCSVAQPDSTWSPIGTMVAGEDGKAGIVGRWATCGTGGFQTEPHAGIEFGDNGRFQLLDRDDTGGLVPHSSVQGRYYLLSGSGQIGLRRDDDNGVSVGFVSFSPDQQALTYLDAGQGGGSIYARTSPSPDSGRDNAPSTTDGACSLVGAWITDFTPDSALVIYFDAAGNFAAEDPSTGRLCAPNMHGTYRVSPGMFEITQNVGMGVCSFWFDAGYAIKFESDCSRVYLENVWDNCTGGRGYLSGSTQLVPRF